MSPILLVTGSSSGIGRDTAVAAAAAGYTAVATVRDLGRTEGLRKAAADAGVTLDIRRLDVTDDASIDDCLRGVIETYGHLDVLVNNAGVANSFPTIEMSTMAAFRANFDVNFFGVVATTRAALPYLRASGGRVVTIGSTRGLIGHPFNEAYSSAKAGIEGFMESLAPVAGGMGVTVTLVEPGPVVSSFAANSGVTWDTLRAAAGPYNAVLEPYLRWLERNGWPGMQSSAEVAEVVVATLADPDPAFRTMTSQWAAEYAGIKYADLDGRAVRAMVGSWFAPAEDGAGHGD